MPISAIESRNLNSNRVAATDGSEVPHPEIATRLATARRQPSGKYLTDDASGLGSPPPSSKRSRLCQGRLARTVAGSFACGLPTTYRTVHSRVIEGLLLDR